MTPRQLQATKNHYREMFGSEICPDSYHTLQGVTDLDALEEERENLSAGEFDAAEAILLGL